MKIEADLMKTEDEKLVEKCVKNLFPDASLEKIEGKLVGETDGSRFYELADKQEIRAIIDKRLQENGSIELNKTAAFAGKVAVDEKYPIGDIRLFL